MQNNTLQLSAEEQLHFKQLITDRFVDNPRMSMLFDKNKKNFKKNVFNLVDYCFTLALRLDGVFISSNKKTIILFYEKRKFKKTLKDHLNYIKVAMGIPLSQISKILKKEKKIKSHQLKLDNFIYVWFIAQERGYGKLDGLGEINQKLIQLSMDSKLPLLFETSDNKLLRFYHYVGFSIYKELEQDGDTIYFLSRMSASE